jgi:hypothetical protein
VYSQVSDDDDAAGAGAGASASPRRGLFAKEALASGALVVTLPPRLPLTLHASSLPYKRRAARLDAARPECGARAHAHAARRRAPHAARTRARPNPRPFSLPAVGRKP